MAEQSLDGEMRLAGVGRPEDSLDASSERRIEAGHAEWLGFFARIASASGGALTVCSRDGGYGRGMPTVFRAHGFRFYFVSHDLKEPPHVHVERGGAAAKFWLERCQLARNDGFPLHGTAHDLAQFKT
jgi:hypothetical protein